MKNITLAFATNIDNHTAYHVKKLNKNIGPTTEIVINMGRLSREILEHSEYTKDTHLIKFYGEKIIRIDGNSCLNDLNLIYERTLVIVKEERAKRYFILDKTNDLIFIPLSNSKKNIYEYGFTELINFDKIKNYSFCCKSKKGKKYVGSKNSTMHEIIIGESINNTKIDHYNSNGLDNRTINLRFLTDSENSANKKPKENGYTGATWFSPMKKWRATITHKKVRYFLGYFDTAEEAAKQYDIFSTHFFPGVRYNLNQINGSDSLTPSEIEEIKNNPEKYNSFLEKKIRDLPDNIVKTEKSFSFRKELTKRFSRLEDCERYLESLKKEFPFFANLQKAKAETNGTDHFIKLYLKKNDKELEVLENLSHKLKIFIEELDNLENEKIIADIEKSRNKEGDAIIKVNAAKNEKYIDLEIDDRDWKEYILLSLHDNGGYPADGKNGNIHIEIFKKYYPEEYKNRKEGETVDHIDGNPYNVKLKNLRLSSKSLQAQNRKRERKRLIDYTGVYIRNGKFFATFMGKNSKKVDTLEEAALLYNEMALEFDKGARINKIIEGETRFEDIYGKENLPSIIDKINTIGEIKEIIRFNGWRKEFKIGHLTKGVRAEHLKHYKNLIIEKLKSEQ
jgi:hypothetical protein